MNYIWEVKLYNKEEVFFEQAKSFSPYYEVSPDYLNGNNTKLDIVELNSLYRFDSIFSALFADGLTDEEWKKYLFDSCIHFLINEDLKSGYTKKELRVRHVMKEIEDGLYGPENQLLFIKLELTKKYTLANYLVDQKQLGESITLFAKVLIELLENGIVYKNSTNPKELLIYLGEEKSDHYVLIIKLAVKFFLPLNVSIRVFWKNHFALIGNEQTMKYERIEIF